MAGLSGNMTFAPTFQPQTQWGTALANIANAFTTGPSPIALDYYRSRLNLAKARTQKLQDEMRGRQEIADIISNSPLDLQGHMNEIAATAIRRGVPALNIAQALRIAAAQRGVSDQQRGAMHVAAGGVIRPKDRFSLTGPPAAPVPNGPAVHVNTSGLDAAAKNLSAADQAAYNYWKAKGRADKMAEIVRKANAAKAKQPMIDLKRKNLQGQIAERERKAAKLRQPKASDRSSIASAVYSQLRIPWDGDQYMTDAQGNFAAPNGKTYTPTAINRITSRAIEYWRDGDNAYTAVNKAINDLNTRGALSSTPAKNKDMGKTTTTVDSNPKVPFYQRPKRVRTPKAKTPAAKNTVTETKPQSYRPLPANRSDLKIGMRYRLPDGRIGVFDGKQFTDVK